LPDPTPQPGNTEPEVEVLSSHPTIYDDAGNAAVIPGESPILPEAAAEIEEWKKKHAEAREQLLWVAADFDNYKKRALKEKEEYLKFSHAGILREFLGVVDNLERAVALAQKKGQETGPADGLKEGVELTLRQFQGLLQKAGVAKIKTVGENFDPRLHEVMYQEETEQFPDGTVMEELQSGYSLQERVLRPALVKVAKNSKPVNG